MTNKVFDHFRKITNRESYESCKNRILEKAGFTESTPSFFNPDYESAIKMLTFKDYRRVDSPWSKDSLANVFQIYGERILLDLPIDFLAELMDYTFEASIGLTRLEEERFLADRSSYVRNPADITHRKRYVALDALLPFLSGKDVSLGRYLSWHCKLGGQTPMLIESDELTDHAVNAYGYVVSNRRGLKPNQRESLDSAVNVLLAIATNPFDPTNPYQFDTNFRYTRTTEKARNILRDLAKEDKAYSFILDKPNQYDDQHGVPFRDLEIKGVYRPNRLLGEDSLSKWMF